MRSSGQIPQGQEGLGSPAAVLARAGGAHAARMRADADLLAAGCAWADLHPVRPGEPGATLIERWGDTGLSVAGPGAPLVEEFSVPAFAAQLGLRSEAGAALIGEALELRHRLPRLWARVQACQVEAWRARRIAQTTIRRELSVEAAGFVDRHLAPVAASAGLPTIERCVEEAVARTTPETDQRDPDNPTGPDRRGFAVDKRQVSFEGTLECHGTLDLADALAVDDAVREEVRRLRRLGATQAAGPLSAVALAGLVTRRDPTLEEALGDHDGTETPGAPTRRHRDRAVLLHLHLSASAVTGSGAAGGVQVGRVEETRAPVTAEQVRAWCGAPATTHLRVLPVLDLDQRSHVEQYEMPERMQQQAALSALTCVFPWCTRPARSCDTDHVEPHDRDHEAGPEAEPGDQPGPTASDNAGPLCRRHHRLKTHAPARHRWRITQLDHGLWLWRSPHGEHYLRDHRGTHPVDRGPAGPPG